MFETKKIQSETLNEYLTEVRERLGLSVDEVAEKSGVMPKFIYALEEGKFHQLPPTVYVLGFLRNLARVYAIPSEDLIEQFKKERQIDQHLTQTETKSAQLARKARGSMVITPKSLSAAVGLLFVFATIVYVIWQVFSINKTPALEIYQPTDRQIVHDSYVVVSGKTDPGMAVTINGENVFVEETGNFKSQVGVGNGPKDLVFVAKNKFDKSVSKTVTVIGDTETQVADSSTPATTTPAVTLELQCLGQVGLKIVVDNGTPQTSDCSAGSSLRFQAITRVSVTTDDAGSTKVFLNGKNLGVMGRPKETLTDIPFTADSVPVLTPTTTP